MDLECILTMMPCVKGDRQYMRLVTAYLEAFKKWCADQELASTILGLSSNELEESKHLLLRAIEARLNEVIDEFEEDDEESEEPRDENVSVNGFPREE